MNNVDQFVADLRLKFNVENPNIEECYVDGYSSALSEMNESDNPYPAESKAAEHWLEGWWDGLYGKQPLFSLSDSIENSILDVKAANENVFHECFDKWLIKILEISGVIAVSALVGYQLIDLVA